MSQRNRLPYRHEELFGLGPQRTYRGPHLDEIAFPLGGIGTGSVSLGGWGQLRDWEMRNRPAKGRTLPNAFFCVRVQEAGEAPQVRVLQGPGAAQNKGGHSRAMTPARACRTSTRSPSAASSPSPRCSFATRTSRSRRDLTAFNPFIPLNDTDSSIPVAMLIVHAQEPRQAAPQGLGHGQPDQRHRRGGGARQQGQAGGGASQGLVLGQHRHRTTTTPQCGSMVLATPGGRALGLAGLARRPHPQVLGSRRLGGAVAADRARAAATPAPSAWTSSWRPASRPPFPSSSPGTSPTTSTGSELRGRRARHLEELVRDAVEGRLGRRAATPRRTLSA